MQKPSCFLRTYILQMFSIMIKSISWERKHFRNLAENLIFFICLNSNSTELFLKFRYSEKATQFEKYPNSVWLYLESSKKVGTFSLKNVGLLWICELYLCFHFKKVVRIQESRWKTRRLSNSTQSLKFFLNFCFYNSPNNIKLPSL